MFDNWIEKMCGNFYFYRFDINLKTFKKIKNQCTWKICFSILFCYFHLLIETHKKMLQKI